MGQPGAAQFATAFLERSHRQRNVMPSSWPAELRSCADGFNAHPSTGRATLTFTWAGAKAAGAGAATIFCLARRLRRGAALSLARRLGGRRAASARFARRPGGRAPREFYRLPLQRSRRVRRARLRQQPASRWVSERAKAHSGLRSPGFTAAAMLHKKASASVLQDARSNPFFTEKSHDVKGVVGDIRTVRSMREKCCLILPAAHYCPICRGWRQQNPPKLDHPARN